MITISNQFNWPIKIMAFNHQKKKKLINWIKLKIKIKIKPPNLGNCECNMQCLETGNKKKSIFDII